MQTVASFGEIDYVSLLSDEHIQSSQKLQKPCALQKEVGDLTQEMARNIYETRQEIVSIQNKEPNARFMIIVGPCSHHSYDGSMEYARRLKELQAQVSDQILLIMRMHFEKPRTTIGWQGSISQPYLDGRYDYNTGLRNAIQVLYDIAALGVPVSTEFLDSFVPQYIGHLVSWSPIGARTAQGKHCRSLMSGLSLPIGCKNDSSGHIQSGVEAMIACSYEQAFPGVSVGSEAVVSVTKGNPNSQLVLRGGRYGPNYSVAHVTKAVNTINMLSQQAGIKLNESVLVDCAHGNLSSKDRYKEQIYTAQQVVKNMAKDVLYRKTVDGLMIESNVKEGRQEIALDDIDPLLSCTDPCIGWSDTENLILRLHDKLKSVKSF